MLWKPLSVNHITMWFGQTGLNVETSLSASVNGAIDNRFKIQFGDDVFEVARMVLLFFCSMMWLPRHGMCRPFKSVM